MTVPKGVIDLREAVHNALADAADRQELAELRAGAERYRYAWAEGKATLYKFKSLSGEGAKHVEDIIENSRLYFSVPDQFNDPMDCSPVFKLAGDLKDPAFVAELRRNEDEMFVEKGMTSADADAMRAKQGYDVSLLAAEVTREFRQHMRTTTPIFCLSDSQLHPLFWSHYADSHKGVCLHFEVAHDTLAGQARAVEYRRDRAPILIPLHYNEDTDELIRKMVLVKADFWSYESEYRIIGSFPPDSEFQLQGRFGIFSPDMLTGITLGMFASPSDRDIVMRWAKEHIPKLNVFEAFEDPDQFAIDVRQIA